MNVHSQLLLLGVLPKHYKLWWQNGSRLTDWFNSSTLESVPLPSYRYGRERDVHTKLFLRRNNPDVVELRSVKTDWQCRPARKW